MRFPSKFKDNSGVALVTALVLTLISLGMIVAALYMLSIGTEISGLFKRYQNSLEAAKGGFKFFTKEFLNRKIGGESLSSIGTYGGNVSYGTDDATITQKLISGTPDWSCGDECKSLNVKEAYDLTVSFPPNFICYVKLVNTVLGNTDTSGLALEGSGVVEAGSGIISPLHFPFMYRIEVQGERGSNPDERAIISGLYLY